MSKQPLLIMACAAVLLFAGSASAATEAEVATTRTTVNILLPVLSIALMIVVVLILKAVKLESKAGETPWSIVFVMLVVFVLGTMSSTLLAFGPWVSDAIVKAYHGTDAAAKKDDGKGVAPVPSRDDPLNPTYKSATGEFTVDNDAPEKMHLLIYWKGGSTPPTDANGGKVFGRTRTANIGVGATDVKAIFATEDGSKMSKIVPAAVK